MPRQPGFLAKTDGDCARCDQPILAKQDRVVPVSGHVNQWMHVGCASGADDENPPTSRRGDVVATRPDTTGDQAPSVDDGGAEQEAGRTPPAAPPLDPAIELATNLNVSTWIVNEPGIVDGMPNQTYHAHPNPWEGSISSSGIKLMLDAPAVYHAALTAEREPTAAMNLGSAAHFKVLGEGPKIVAHGYAELRTNEAKARVREILAAGDIPLRPKEVVVVDAMAKKLEEHPLASLLFANGKAEQSAFYTDPDTGVRCRARFDWLPHKVPGKRLIVPDFKTTENANPRRFGRHAYDFGYDIQDAHYRAAIRALGLDDNPGFLFVVQAKTPPYLVSINQLDAPSRELGEKRRARALAMYAECLAADDWPGYTTGIHQTTLPTFAFYDQERYDQ